MLRRVPQIDPRTGISADFGTQFAALGVLRMRRERPDLFTDDEVLDELKTQQWRQYEERFPTDRYAEVITERNKVGIARLNEIVIQVKDLIASADLVESITEELWKLRCEAELLISGNEVD